MQVFEHKPTALNTKPQAYRIIVVLAMSGFDVVPDPFPRVSPSAVALWTEGACVVVL